MLSRVFSAIIITAFLISFISCDRTKDRAEFGAHNPSDWPSSFGFGRIASAREIDSIDIDVNPQGVGLPAGSGNVHFGKQVYAAKCEICHGKNGREGPYNKLVAVFHEADSLQRGEKAIGNYWPYATTVYDYINRAMPYNAPGTLSPDEVYALTAFLLYKNNLIDSTVVIDAKNLPLVQMPARNFFVDDDRVGGAELK